MNLKQFTKDALRTESVPDVIEMNAVMFGSLQSAMLDLVDCFDLIKKNAFYGKPIDVARFTARLVIAEDTIAQLKERCQTTPEYINASDEVPVDPRAFHGILGLLTEAGELLELVDLNAAKIDPLKIADELGDALWYIAITAESQGIDLEEQVLEGVIAKLRKRFPDKFDAALATVRDKEAELAETSAVTGITDEAAMLKGVGKPVNKGGRPRKKPPTVAEGKTKSNTKSPTRKAGTRPAAPAAPKEDGIADDAAGGESFV